MTNLAIAQQSGRARRNRIRAHLARWSREQREAVRARQEPTP